MNMVKEIIGKSQSSEQVRAFISKAAKLERPHSTFRLNY